MHGVEWPKSDNLDAWAWFEKELSSSKDDFLFVVDHMPVYTICSHGHTARLSELPNILSKYNVSAFLSGHDHCMMHLKFQGNHYIQSGAGSQAWNIPSWERTTIGLGVEVPFAM